MFISDLDFIDDIKIKVESLIGGFERVEKEDSDYSEVGRNRARSAGRALAIGRSAEAEVEADAFASKGFSRSRIVGRARPIW